MKFELRIIPRLYLYFIHHETKEEFIFGIDNAKVHLKAVV